MAYEHVLPWTPQRGGTIPGSYQGRPTTNHSSHHNTGKMWMPLSCGLVLFLGLAANNMASAVPGPWNCFKLDVFVLQIPQGLRLGPLLLHQTDKLLLNAHSKSTSAVKRMVSLLSSARAMVAKDRLLRTIADAKAIRRNMGESSVLINIFYVIWL